MAAGKEADNGQESWQFQIKLELTRLQQKVLGLLLTKGFFNGQEPETVEIKLHRLMNYVLADRCVDGIIVHCNGDNGNGRVASSFVLCPALTNDGGVLPFQPAYNELQPRQSLPDPLCFEDEFREAVLTGPPQFKKDVWFNRIARADGVLDNVEQI